MFPLAEGNNIKRGPRLFLFVQTVYGQGIPEYRGGRLLDGLGKGRVALVVLRMVLLFYKHFNKISLLLLPMDAGH